MTFFTLTNMDEKNEIINSYLNERASLIRANDVYESSLRVPTRRKRRALLHCVDKTCFLETTNHLTNGNPPFLGGPFKYQQDAVLTGYIEQASIYSSGETTLTLNDWFAWAYRDKPVERALNDTYYRSYNGALTFELISLHNLIDPATGELFVDLGWAFKYKFWRRVVQGVYSTILDRDDAKYDGYVAAPRSLNVTTMDFKPLPLHLAGKSMSYMRPSLAYFDDYRLYGWFFQRHQRFPDFSDYTVENLPAGASSWSTSQLASWKSMMASLVGETNPYYVEVVSK